MKVKTKKSKYFVPQNNGKEHVCDFPGCKEKGEYRAPKDKSLKEYYWFCLEHVSQYNEAWNYETSEGESKEDTPHKMHFGGFSSKIKYQFGYDFIDELGDMAYLNENDWKTRIYFSSHDRECADILEVSLEHLTVDSLKKQYKKLARKYHPDMNAGNKECEEKFKKITTAYNDLRRKINP